MCFVSFCIVDRGLEYVEEVVMLTSFINGGEMIGSPTRDGYLAVQVCNCG